MSAGEVGLVFFSLKARGRFAQLQRLSPPHVHKDSAHWTQWVIRKMKTRKRRRGEREEFWQGMLEFWEELTWEVGDGCQFHLQLHPAGVTVRTQVVCRMNDRWIERS